MSDDRQPARRSWAEALAVYRHPRVLAIALLGFSAGLPYLLVFTTLSAWLREAGVSLSAIGFFGWVGITYSVKVLWAPVIDRLRLPFIGRLGKRRSWMLLAQCGIAAGLAGMAVSDPVADLQRIAVLAVAVAFASATQDVAVDAYRIEALEQDKQGAMAAAYVFGYRVALLVAGAGVLYLAEFLSWREAYLAMAALMLVGITTALAIAEPEHTRAPDALAGRPAGGGVVAHAAAVFVAPFVEFFRRTGWHAVLILALIGLFRLSDISMGNMANPFYLDMGFSKTEIAEITKVYGFFMTIAGSALGGVIVARYGLTGPLMLGAVMVALTNLLFATMAGLPPSLVLLAAVISADNVSGGLANAVFIAYLSSLTNKSYTAAQYALFSSLMTLPGKFVSGFSGIVAESFGYALFFCYAAALGLPAILLVALVRRLPALRGEPVAQAPGGRAAAAR